MEQSKRQDMDQANCGSAARELRGFQEIRKAEGGCDGGGALTPIAVFTSGAKSSVRKPWYRLIPIIAMELIAERFAYGAQRHGERNYRKGADDAVFINDRINHLIEHTMRYAETRSREDLSAVGCNFAILADLGAFVGSEQERNREQIAGLRTQEHQIMSVLSHVRCQIAERERNQ